MLSRRSIVRFFSLNVVGLFISCHAFGQDNTPQLSAAAIEDSIAAQQDRDMLALNRRLNQDLQTISARQQQIMDDALRPTTIGNSLSQGSKVNPGIEQRGYWRSIVIRSDGKHQQQCIQQAQFKGNGQRVSITNAQATGNQEGCLSPQSLTQNMGNLFPTKNQQDMTKVIPIMDLSPHAKDPRSKERKL